MSQKMSLEERLNAITFKPGGHWLLINDMLEITRLVLKELVRDFEENEAYATRSIEFLKDALLEVPDNLDEVREIDKKGREECASS